jgi:hypothetical protein|tara:strand:+ start:223 stop:687 length:465 start_codon:yes stop_codon:yes gene_type:complete
MDRLRHLITAHILSVACLLSAPAFGELETLSWQDLLPQLDETLNLDDGVPWAERVRLDLNGKKVRIPGFIVPVDFENRQVVTRFLLVPYFGACMHEPAPPPNQTIYAEFEPGYEVGALWYPFWIEGTISASRVEESLATASYTLQATNIEPYKE